MLRAVIELSKYILAANIVLYVLISFIAISRDDRKRKDFIFVLQYIMIFINHMTGSLVLLSSRKDFTYLFFQLFQDFCRVCKFCKENHGSNNIWLKACFFV